MVSGNLSLAATVMFDNPFHIEDLLVLDCETMKSILLHNRSGAICTQLAHSLHGASDELIQRFLRYLPEQRQRLFQQEIERDLAPAEVSAARQLILNKFFWELIYWKTPNLYEELTEGEHLHPGIFQALEPDLACKTVLDVGAGSGRASFECRRVGAAKVYAVEPSSGLLRILRQKTAARGEQQHIIPSAGRFDQILLPNQSVDTVISCSAFTAADEQGGEAGLKEMLRVLRPGGKIAIIWPRSADHKWLQQHGFHYVELPVVGEMSVAFRSYQSAVHCAKLFYAHNPAVLHYIEAQHTTEVPFSVIGMNPPRDYCWLCPDR
jgi:ubiquinone/menaquinone biosynthesis C-methylase UbiE